MASLLEEIMGYRPQKVKQMPAVSFETINEKLDRILAILEPKTPAATGQPTASAGTTPANAGQGSPVAPAGPAQTTPVVAPPPPAAQPASQPAATPGPTAAATVSTGGGQPAAPVQPTK